MIFEETFFPETKNADWKELQKYWEFMEQCFIKYKPKYNLTNAVNFLFPVNPQNQEWIDKTIARTAAAIIKKKAMVMSSDFIAQLSIQLTLEENNASDINIKHFESRQEALNWLLNE